MEVFVVRHGAVEPTLDAKGQELIYGPDANMSDVGVSQMQKLGTQLVSEGVTLQAVYRSRYKRAIESTDILKETLHFESVIPILDLRDVHPNSGEGQPAKELAKRGGDVYASPFSDKQETLVQISQRARKTIRKILKDAQDSKFKTIGVVSHGDLISAIDWGLKHEENPTSYEELKSSFYLQKAEACHYVFDRDLHLVGEGRVISIPEVQLSAEGFR